MKTYYEIIVNFLVGAAWALTIILSAKLFFSFLDFGLLYAILAALIGVVVGLFLVLLTELFMIQIKKLKEIQKHTELLEEILKKINKEND